MGSTRMQPMFLLLLLLVYLPLTLMLISPLCSPQKPLQLMGQMHSSPSVPALQAAQEGDCKGPKEGGDAYWCLELPRVCKGYP